MIDKPESGNADEYPTAFQPVVFADGVSSSSWGQGVVKFFLYRSEPHFRASAPTKDQVFAQVVMPTRGFIAMAAFFENTINKMLDDKTLSKEVLDAVRSTYADTKGDG